VKRYRWLADASKKLKAPLQSRQGRETFARRMAESHDLHKRLEQGELRLFCAFDGDRMCGMSLMENSHIRHFYIESRYRRSDAGPLLLDYMRSIHPQMTAEAPLTEAELLRECGFEGDEVAQNDGLKYVVMHTAKREPTHEIWDLRDEIGEPTGRYASRDQYRSLRSGEYMLAVHIYLYTPDGRFLIQKRSLQKDVLPGVWDMTGGAAKAGEDGRAAAIRETQEEIGLSLSPAQLQLAARLKRKRSFVELWFAKVPIDPRRCVLQEGEVDEVKLIGRREMIDLIKKAKHRDAIYKHTAIRAIQSAK
jgi:8-oxo-dGTP pyrophosphatase MutT (NUDIX family)